MSDGEEEGGGHSDREERSDESDEDSWTKRKRKQREDAAKRAKEADDQYDDEDDYDDEDEEDGSAPTEESDKETDVEVMMKNLTAEEEMGMFRALKAQHALLAAAYRKKQAEGRVPDVNTSFGTAKEKLVLRARTESGYILTDGYRRTVGDEHGYYAEFSLGQLNHDIALQRQPATKLSQEYAWTRFRAPSGLDVYYAGGDPFVKKTAKPAQPSSGSSGTAPVATPARAKTTAKPMKGLVPLTNFFQAKPRLPPPPPKEQQQEEGSGEPSRKRIAVDVKAAPTAAAAAKGAPAASKSSIRRKHARFARDMFYVRVLDVVATSNTNTTAPTPSDK